MYRLLTAIGLVAAIVLIVASATMNYAFVSSLGKTPFEGYVLGTVGVAVDVLKAVIAMFIAKALRDGQRTFVIVGSCAFALFAVGSFVAAAGFSSVNRGAVTEGRRSLALELDEVARELARVRITRDALTGFRATTMIDEALASLRIDARWRASRECDAPVTSTQRELCVGVSSLRLELATAKEAARLDVIIAGFSERMISLRAKGASAAADPQAQFLAQSLGLSEGAVQRVLMTMIALIVEVSSALGIYLATGHGGVTRSQSRATEPVQSDIITPTAPSRSASVIPGSPGVGEPGPITPRQTPRATRASLSIGIAVPNPRRD